MPRMPKPPGTQIASTSLRWRRGAGRASRTRRRRSSAGAPWPRARSRRPAAPRRPTGRRRAGRCTCRPAPTVTSSCGWCTRRSRSSQRGPVDVAERQVEPAYDVGVEALAVQHLGDVVDRRGVGGGDHGLLVDVAHQRDLPLDPVRDLPVGAADDGVGLDTDRAQRGDRVLGGLGLQLAGRADVGHQRDVEEEAVVAADVVADLARRLEERQRLDVTDGAADLGDHDVDVRRRPWPGSGP